MDQRDPENIKHKDWVLTKLESVVQKVTDVIPPSLSPNFLMIVSFLEFDFLIYMISLCLYIILFLTLWFYYCSAEYEQIPPSGSPRCKPSWHFYVAWVIIEWVTFAFSTASTYHRDKTFFNCPAMKYFWFWVDVLDECISGIISATVMPYVKPVPPFWLVMAHSMLLYSNMLRYYQLRLLTVPYNVNIYITTVFALLTAFLPSMEILRIVYTAVMACGVLGVLIYFTLNVVTVARHHENAQALPWRACINSITQGLLFVRHLSLHHYCALLYNILSCVIGG